MSDERVISDFGDDSKDSKSNRYESPESTSVRAAEDSQLTLIDLSDRNKDDNDQLSEDNVIKDSSLDEFQRTFHLSDLPPIHSHVIHAPMPSDIAMPAPVLSDSGMHAPLISSAEQSQNSDNKSTELNGGDHTVQDQLASQKLKSVDGVAKESCDNSDNKPISYHEIENTLDMKIVHSDATVKENQQQCNKVVNGVNQIDKVLYTDIITDKNSNCIPLITNLTPNLKETTQPKELSEINTSTNAKIRSSTKFPDNIVTVSLTPLRHCESIPNIIVENGCHVSDRKRHSIYRLSLRLPHCFPLHFDIPNADSHGQYSKAGHLQKLSGRGFPYLNQWKRRYCVLAKGCLYLYEKETSKGSDKNSSVVDLKYFDHVAEAMQKETKKASNVFVVTSQDRSFFDPGRHLFAADTLTEMHDWISKLRESIDLIRNNNRPMSRNAKGQRKDTQEQSTDNDAHQRQSKRTDSDEQQGHMARPKSSPLEDTVDPGIYPTEDTNKEELILNLQRQLQRESEHRESKLDKSSTDLLKEEDDMEDESAEAQQQQHYSKKKLSFTTISLQNPNLRVDAKPRLESITKNRIRGPAGRRAPQSRRTIQMKQRASSMSALQHEGQLDDEARDEVCGQNTHDGYAEEEILMIDAGSLNSSQPILAYHYSSDEDSLEEDNMGSNRSIGKPVSEQYNSGGETYSSKATSFTIDEVPHHPVKGLRVYVSKEALVPSVDNLSHPFPDPDAEELLEYRSLPRSLAKASNNNRTLAMKTLSKGLQASTSSGGRGSVGRLASGKVSSDMDALDNLLMKRSLHSGLTGQQEDPCPSDPEGSEASTFKGTHEEPDNKKSSSSINNEELTKALERFSSTLQHLQHHTAELESRTKRIESDFNISKNDVINFQEATEGIRKEVKKLSDTVINVAQEASKAKKDYVSQRQETEKLQNDCAEALSQAKRSQKEFESSKLEYELTIRDLHNLIASIKSSFIVTNPEELKSAKKVTLAETGKSYSENDKSNIIKEEKETVDYRKPMIDGKKAPAKEIITQKGGYQSFFQRPSSLIYGLTARSSNKSPKRDKDDKDTTPKSDKEEKRKSGKSNSDKKQKGEKQNQNSLERKEKGTKTDEYRDTIKDDSKTHSKHKGTSIDKHVKRDDNLEIKKSIPNYSIENFPMMDDHSDSLERRPSNTTGKSHVSINMGQGHASQNFNLEKSCSSPTVTMKYSKKIRPNALSIPPAIGDGHKSYSNTSSPDSPTASFNTYPFMQNNQVDSRETRINRETLFPCQPAHSSVSRQSSMPSSSEDKLVTRHRQGVFAISRQRSSPNLPIQRQSSGTIYPLQRQHSLGTVPEEAQLPRQISLMSVPEDRPIVDQTLPLSPAPSMISFALSPSPSGERLDNLRDRSSARNSMELVTGPVVSGSVAQGSYARQLPPPSEFNINDFPLATSSLKKKNEKKKTCSETLIL